MRQLNFAIAARTHPGQRSVSLRDLGRRVAPCHCGGWRGPVLEVDIALPALDALVAVQVDTDGLALHVPGEDLPLVAIGTRGARNGPLR